MIMRIIILIIVVILCIWYLHRRYSKFTASEPYDLNKLYVKKQPENPISGKIPPIIFQTYYDKGKIPQKVYDNLKNYAKGYELKILDDNDAVEFLKENFKDNILQTFNKLKVGAHKADLLRYCLLYIYGGIYLDIKTELIKPINEIFRDTYKDINNLVYTCLSIHGKTIYQGILASTPRNYIFLRLINFIVQVPEYKVNYNYLIFTDDFYDKILEDVDNPIQEGINKGKSSYYYLFKEKCSKNKADCSDGLDRYGLCCNIYDKDIKIFKTRYSDFPW